MKTSMKSLLVAFSLIVLMGTYANSKAATTPGVTVLNSTKKINTIHVTGNVKVILVQSFEESVKVYNDYYAKNALVQQNGNDLRISSFEKEPLTVVVNATNITEISASGQANIKTFGNFNLLSVVVNLKDTASAQLKMNTIELYTNLSGAAALTLSGSTTAYGAVMDSFSTLNLDQFAAESSNIKSITKVSPAINPKRNYQTKASLLGE